MIRVGEVRTDGTLSVTIEERSPRGVYLAVAPGLRLWGTAGLIAEYWPDVLAAEACPDCDYEGPCDAHNTLIGGGP